MLEFSCRISVRNKVYFNDLGISSMGLTKFRQLKREMKMVLLGCFDNFTKTLLYGAEIFMVIFDIDVAVTCTM